MAGAPRLAEPRLRTLRRHVEAQRRFAALGPVFSPNAPVGQPAGRLAAALGSVSGDSNVAAATLAARPGPRLRLLAALVQRWAQLFCYRCSRVAGPTALAAARAGALADARRAQPVAIALQGITLLCGAWASRRRMGRTPRACYAWRTTLCSITLGAPLDGTGTVPQ